MRQMSMRVPAGLRGTAAAASWTAPSPFMPGFCDALSLEYHFPDVPGFWRLGRIRGDHYAKAVAAEMPPLGKVVREGQIMSMCSVPCCKLTR